MRPRSMEPPKLTGLCPRSTTHCRCPHLRAGMQGDPPPHHVWVSSGLPTLGCPRTHQFCGILAEPVTGGCFGLISKRNVYVSGRQEGGEEKHHSSALGKRKIVLEAAAVIADKSRSHQITQTLIQNRRALNNQRLAPHYGNETFIYFGRAQNFPLFPRPQIQSPQTGTAASRREAGTFLGCVPPTRPPFPPHPQLTFRSRRYPCRSACPCASPSPCRACRW